MSEQIKQVLIIGGGTAGWLSAAILASQLASAEQGGIQITLVESPDIPILGVGEGTWPNLRATLQKIGVSESDFIRECDATFKQGAEFINWRETPESGKSHSYYHPLATVNHSSYDFNLAPFWLLQDANSRQAYDQSVAAQARLCDAGLAPKQIVMPEYSAAQEYAYHLNANKFADFLRKHCTQKLGVGYVSANVTQVCQDSMQYITHVCTDNPETPQLHADFFIDCSGSKGLLINLTYQIPWVDISKVIFNDTALAVQVPYPETEQPIKTHTLATAQTAGWIWDIGLQQRRGVGHVYSSQHISEDQASQQLIDYINQPEQQLSLRKIKLNHGYRQKFWHKNTVAIGMSAGFIEPLEASAIYLFDAAANMIASQFPVNRQQMAYVEKQFNQHFSMRMQRSIDFIKLHYCISKRRDSEYWIENCQAESIPELLQQRLEHWKYQVPTKYDFDNAWEPFNLDSYLYVLYGMGYDTQLQNTAKYRPLADRANALFADVNKLSELLKQKLPPQRELISKVCQYGFNKV